MHVPLQRPQYFLQLVFLKSARRWLEQIPLISAQTFIVSRHASINKKFISNGSGMVVVNIVNI
jgi:hypothetical protein